MADHSWHHFPCAPLQSCVMAGVSPASAHSPMPQPIHPPRLRQHAPVAQLVERPPCKRQVAGSSPAGSSNGESRIFNKQSDSRQRPATRRHRQVVKAAGFDPAITGSIPVVSARTYPDVLLAQGLTRIGRIVG